ncbi:GH32 C-terminal domain-containing protein, partial [Curtobacterium sp. B18]|uniref:GH32 C-terminal domain-containing protein n=1 Tax=Curtobacterium sp. B18 TaxID=95614 RepID=UPI0004CE8C9F
HDPVASWIGPRLPTEALVTIELDVAPDTRSFGVLLRTSDDAEAGYALRLEPDRSRLVLDRWPRGTTGGEQWQILGDVPHAVELERQVSLAPGPHRIDVHLDGDLCVAVVDGSVALSTRLYDRPSGRIALFAQDGAFALTRVTVGTR